MYFVKFPFDDHSCIFEMLLDEVLHVNMTLSTEEASLRIVQASEQSYEYEVSEEGKKSFFN